MVLAAPAVANAQSGEAQVESKKRLPLSQEEREERELERVYGTQVERDNMTRGGNDRSTFDRYGDGRLGTFQNANETDRNLEESDAIGINLRLFEFE
tara:strand:- start:381 stop:671 length:291 start_codon:yes stop_codon:yes gene_type:complete